MSAPQQRLRKATWLAIASQLLLAAVAVRHMFFWGAGQPVLGFEPYVWLNIGEALGLGLFAALGTLAMHRALAVAPQVSPRALLIAGAGVAAMATLVPPFLSSDVFDYIARGRVEAHYGGNPYVTTVSSLHGDDPVLAQAEWPDFVMPYGPISALVQAGCAWLGGSSPWLGVYAFKLMMALAFLGTGWLLGLAAGNSRQQVMAGWLFHPWLALECCGSAHNEALVALCLAVMVLGIARDRLAGGTFGFGLAVLTKHGCAPLGPALLALAAWRRRLPAFALGVALTAVLTGALAWRYFREPHALDFLVKQTGNRGTSVQHFVSLLFDGSASALLLAGYAATLLAVVASCALSRDAARFASAGTRLLVLFILLAMPLFSPWYHLWWLPLCALLPAGAPAQRALRVLAWAGPLSYAVYAATRNLDLPHQAWAWFCACALPAFVALRRETPPAAAHEQAAL